MGYALIDFLAVHGNLPRCTNSKPYLITFYAKYGYSNVIADYDRFPNTAREYEHSLRYFSVRIFSVRTHLSIPTVMLITDNVAAYPSISPSISLISPCISPSISMTRARAWLHAITSGDEPFARLVAQLPFQDLA